MKSEVKKDSRTIDFVDEFLPGGKLNGFRKIIDKNRDFPLEMCFRGNSGNMAVIYYNNHRFFIIKKTDGYFSLELIFNHARYTEGWKIEQSKLVKLGFRQTSAKEKKMQFQTKEMYDDEFIGKVYNIMMPIMKDFFCESKQIDEFKKFENLEKTNRKKPYYIEKIRQQELMSILNNSENGYFVYDLEFQPPHKNKKEQEQDENNNKPDMLAVKFIDRRPEKITFVEVKSTKEACNGKSGFLKHRDCMINYSKQKKDLDARREEACEIINDYAKLQLRNLDIDNVFDSSQFENIGVEILFVFTDKAILFYNKNKEELISQEGVTYALYDENQKKLIIM